MQDIRTGDLKIKMVCRSQPTACCNLTMSFPVVLQVKLCLLQVFAIIAVFTTFESSVDLIIKCYKCLCPCTDSTHNSCPARQTPRQRSSSKMKTTRLETRCGTSS